MTSYTSPTWRSSMSAAVTTSATSSASMNGSSTVPAGNASVPSMIGSRRNASLKFWLKKLEVTMVQSRPEPWMADSLASAPSSLRPDTRTIRRTPVAAAVAARPATRSAAPGKERSGWYVTEIAVDSGQRRSPRLGGVPVEGRFAGSRADPNRSAESAQLVGYSAADLAGAAEDE